MTTSAIAASHRCDRCGGRLFFRRVPGHEADAGQHVGWCINCGREVADRPPMPYRPAQTEPRPNLTGKSNTKRR